jgi:hypothetical protein
MAPEIDAKAADGILDELRDVVGSMAFAPPEGMHLHQRNAANALNRIGVALGLVSGPDGAPEAPSPMAVDETRCDFCDKSKREVKKLVAGLRATICDECISLANGIVAGVPHLAIVVSAIEGNIHVEMSDAPKCAKARGGDSSPVFCGYHAGHTGDCGEWWSEAPKHRIERLLVFLERCYPNEARAWRAGEYGAGGGPEDLAMRIMEGQWNRLLEVSPVKPPEACGAQIRLGQCILTKGHTGECDASVQGGSRS